MFFYDNYEEHFLKEQLLRALGLDANGQIELDSVIRESEKSDMHAMLSVKLHKMFITQIRTLILHLKKTAILQIESNSDRLLRSANFKPPANLPYSDFSEN
ncbi:hypothetical protein B6D60_07690 [candidate division KSB1 bacterium 4484_87]|nr:MAG: hypothetical protein B6D60_07690 [candidate division KSB1 bacterium 4484_87]